MSNSEFKSLIAAQRGAVLIKTHAPPILEPFGVDTGLLQYVRSLAVELDVVYVYRDGRDLLVSLCYYMRNYDRGIRKVPFSDFIRMQNRFDTMPRSKHRFNRVEYWKFHVEGWLEQSAVSSVSYEDLHRDYEMAVTALATRLGLEIKENVRPVALPHSGYLSSKLLSFARRVGDVMRGQSSATSSAILPHKGITGEWVRHFSDQDISFFDGIAGDLLQELGYSRGQNCCQSASLREVAQRCEVSLENTRRVS